MVANRYIEPVLVSPISVRGVFFYKNEMVVTIALYAEEKYNHYSKGGKRPPPFLDPALGP